MFNLNVTRNIVRTITANYQSSIVVRNIHRIMLTKSFLVNQNSLLNGQYPSIDLCRNYAKSKDKKKEKKKANVQIQENLLRDIFNVDAFKTDLQKAVENLQQDLHKNVSLRSSSGAIENIKVEVENHSYKLQEIAQISRKSPKMIVVNASAFPQYITDIMKALQQTAMNLNPQQQGTTIYLPIQAVTKQYRKDLAKSANLFFNKFKDTVRDIKNKYTRSLKNKNISEDDRHSAQEQITIIAESYVAKGKDSLDIKQKELIEG